MPHVLWANPDGRTILWDVHPDGSFGIAGDYGGFSDDGTARTVWKARALATGGDGLSRILWNNPDSRILLWDVNPAGTHADSDYGPFSDDGSASTLWQAVAVSAGP